MFFIEIYDKIVGYDQELGITFEYIDNCWKVSLIPLHEIEQMNIREINYLTIKEVQFKTDIKELNNLRKIIRKIYGEM